MPEIINGFVSLLRGMHSGIETPMLPAAQYARGLNVSSRKGLVHTRPKFTELTISDSNFTTGKFQGAGLYRLDAVDRIIVAIAGKVLGISMADLSVIDYTSVAGITMDATVDFYHMVQADKYFIVQDTQGRPLIIDGMTASQSSGTQVPTGYQMAYGHGRIFVVVDQVDAATNLGQRFFVAGDILLPNNVASVLEFTETDYLNTGGALSLPNELGFITALGFLRNVQSGNGLGSLIVLCQNGASAFAVNAQRANWSQIDISQVLFRSGGSQSPYSLISVNNDLMYRGKDGLRTVGYSAASIAGSGAGLNNDPISNEVDDILNLDNETDQKYTSMVYSGNRILTTAVGATGDNGHYFKSLVSIDTSVLSSFGQESPPIYDGIWTGLKFLHVMQAKYNDADTVFMLAKDGTSNKLYYLNESAYVDGSASRPVNRIYTKSYPFTQQDTIAFSLKQFLWMEVSISDIKGQVTLTGYYRPRGYPLWLSCTTATIEATISDSDSLAQRRRKLRIVPTEKSVCDPVTKNNLNIDTDFEFVLQWTGHAKIEKAVFGADDNRKEINIGCSESSVAVELTEGDGDNGVILDDYTIYEVA